jgi:hypothetical protein
MSLGSRVVALIGLTVVPAGAGEGEAPYIVSVRFKLSELER